MLPCPTGMWDDGMAVVHLPPPRFSRTPSREFMSHWDRIQHLYLRGDSMKECEKVEIRENWVEHPSLESLSTIWFPVLRIWVEMVIGVEGRRVKNRLRRLWSIQLWKILLIGVSLRIVLLMDLTIDSTSSMVIVILHKRDSLCYPLNSKGICYIILYVASFHWGISSNKRSL